MPFAVGGSVHDDLVSSGFIVHNLRVGSEKTEKRKVCFRLKEAGAGNRYIVDNAGITLE